MNSVAAPHWFVAVFFAGMVLIWCGWCGIQSLIGGWYRVAKAFPRLQPADVPTFQASMSIGTGEIPLHYLGLWVRVSPEGLELSMFPVLRVFHPPITIPWEELECTRERFLDGQCTVVHVSEARNRLIFAGSEGDWIYDYWNGRLVLEEEEVAELAVAR